MSCLSLPSCKTELVVVANHISKHRAQPRAGSLGKDISALSRQRGEYIQQIGVICYNALVRIPRWAIFLLLLVWLLLAFYPNPAVLVRSIANFRHPDINSAAVASIAKTLPDNPKLIEKAVLDDIVPYKYDWQTTGVPWYFATVSEVLRSKAGDCESRAVVLASILKAKGIDYELKMSFDHIWVDYAGKQSNALENDGQVLAQRENGHLVWRWPSGLNLWSESKAQVADYWTPMPLPRKLALFVGAALLLTINQTLRYRWRRRRHSAAPPATHSSRRSGPIQPLR